MTTFVTEARAQQLLDLSPEAFDIAIFDGATDTDALLAIGYRRVLVSAETYGEARAKAVTHFCAQGIRLDGVYGAQHIRLSTGRSLWQVACEVLP